MDKTLFYAITLVIAMTVGACGSQQNRTNQAISDMSNSSVALDWSGTYFGTIPCADCPGINVELTLNSDLTYTMTRIYQDRPGTFAHSGLFEWNDKGSEIKLITGSNADSFQRYKVQEGTLVLLTPSGDIVKNDNAEACLLGKVEADIVAAGITNKYWKLIELYGNPVSYPEFSVEAFMILSPNGTVSGNLGCNSFFGSFTVEEGNRISFSQLGNTQKMCLDMSIETEMVNRLQMTDNYNITENQFILNRARMAPLARFEVVYMKRD
jgi:heat shock protein HslJ